MSTRRPWRVPLVRMDICMTGCRATLDDLQRGHCRLSSAELTNTSKVCPHSAQRKSYIRVLMIWPPRPGRPRGILPFSS